MKPPFFAALVMSAALTLQSCSAETEQYGGEPEQQLAAATAAADLGRVKQLLASGADPNKMVRHEGHHQSPWKLALHQVRPNRRELIEIVQAMLKARANPEVAWGDAPSRRGLAGSYSAQRSEPILEEHGAREKP